MTAAWFSVNITRIKCGLFAACSLPILWMLAAYWQDDLGSNPLATLTAVSAHSAVVVLIVSLMVTPLRRVLTLLFRQFKVLFGRRMADWNWLVRLRRMLGLWSFAYACLHVLVYLEFDLGWAIDMFVDEAQEKPHLMAAVGAWSILAVLAVTSAKYFVRLLGKNWLRLHRAVYPASLLVLLHYWWLVKPGDMAPLFYSFCLLVLLCYRLLLWVGLMSRWDGCDGQESDVALRIHPNRTTN